MSPAEQLAVEQQRFEAQWLAVRTALERYCRRLTPTHWEDLLQDTQIRAWEKRVQVRSSSISLAWVKQIATGIHNRTYAGIEFTVAMSDAEEPGLSPDMLTAAERVEERMVLMQDSMIWMADRLAKAERKIAGLEAQLGRRVKT
jgi:hypothetical protein